MALTMQSFVSAPNWWLFGLGLAFGSSALLGGTFLVVATVRASNYKGLGESGVYDLLVWGIPLLGLGLAGLLLVLAWRAIQERYALFGSREATD